MASQAQALLADGKLAGSWTLDGAKSSVRLRTKSVWGLVKVNGVFGQVAGEAVISADGQATGTITVAAASIDTGLKKRDDHLRSADFFDAAKYPDITFSATSVALSDDGATVAGTLTVRDQTRPVTVSGAVSADGQDEISLDAEVPVNRGHHGMSFNQLGMMSLDNIIVIHAVFARA
ncbi:MAG TPA: YceI family protein [Trebonia sp.]|jgi:polyisoprenoid-binding protein YceI|nr:YceI family protein [Trebonia sp.]